MHEAYLKQLQQFNSHETDLNMHDDNKHSSDVDTEENLPEHNFIDHEGMIDFDLSNIN